LLASSHWQPPKTTLACHFSLLLRAEQTTVEVGRPIMVELTTANNLGKPLRLGKTNPGTEYQIKVQDEQGKPIAQTPLYKQLQNPGYALRSTTLVLKPQESSKETFDLALFFELRMPGKYSYPSATSSTTTGRYWYRGVQHGHGNYHPANSGRR
jgi:hypothetical protein